MQTVETPIQSTPGHSFLATIQGERDERRTTRRSEAIIAPNGTRWILPKRTARADA